MITQDRRNASNRYAGGINSSKEAGSLPRASSPSDVRLCPSPFIGAEIANVDKAHDRGLV